MATYLKAIAVNELDHCSTFRNGRIVDCFFLVRTSEYTASHCLKIDNIADNVRHSDPGFSCRGRIFVPCKPTEQSNELLRVPYAVSTK